MTTAAIAGVGYTSFTRESGRSVLSLATEACRNALDDAGLAATEVDGIASFMVMHDSVHAQAVARALGVTPVTAHHWYHAWHAHGRAALKSAGRAEFLDAVRRTAAGDAVFSPGLAGLVLGEFRRLAASPAPDTPRLTEREAEILGMVGTGLSYKQIAQRLVLSHRTVQNHVQNTLAKLQLHNRGELIRYAIEHGLDYRPGPDSGPG